MLEWDSALRLAGTPLFMDSRLPQDLCFMSHAHSDHLGRHRRSIVTPSTAKLAGYRIGKIGLEALDYDTPFRPCDNVSITLRPAGHVLGSAMLHATTDRGTLLYTGDFKMRESLTAARAHPVPADYLLMESTYGRPFFRFPAWQLIAEQLVELCVNAMKEGVQPIVYGYSLGKAQEIIAILSKAGLPVTEHGAVFNLTQIYREEGVDLPPTRKYVRGDFHGKEAISLAERGVLVAPPQMSRSAFTTGFDKVLRIAMSGWGLLKGAQFRYGVDHVLPLSDHADFDELLQLIDEVRPKLVYTHHGYKDFVDTLRARGIRAVLARPEAQLSLFEA